MATNEFIKEIAPLIQEHTKLASPVIAQAIVESGWGKSELAWKYHNYFGLKCGSGWIGKSVNCWTWEEYPQGNLKIQDNFRVFDSMKDGVKGYFDFIHSYNRYTNLRYAESPDEYLQMIKDDGYCTSSYYVDLCKSLILSNNLTKYDNVDYKQEVEEHIWTVKKGDTLWTIADTVYGRGTMYPKIMELNNLTSTLIFPGDNLRY